MTDERDDDRQGRDETPDLSDFEGLLDRHYSWEEPVDEEFELPPPIADPPPGDHTAGGGGPAREDRAE